MLLLVSPEDSMSFFLFGCAKPFFFLLHVGFLQLQQAEVTFQLLVCTFLMLQLLLLQSTGSVLVQHGLSCLRHMASSQTRIKPGSYALAGRLFTAAPPGNFYSVSFNWALCMLIHCQTKWGHQPITRRSENQESLPQTSLDSLKKWMDPRDPS